MSYFKSESITSSLKNNFYILTNEKNKNTVVDMYLCGMRTMFMLYNLYFANL